MTEIKKLCDLNIGLSEVILVLKDESGKKPLRMPFRIEANDELLDGLKKIVGDNAVVLK